MLGNRYRNDGKSIIPLNSLQAKIKGQVEEKVRHGIYQVEEVPCCICEGGKFYILAEKDRYGLSLSVAICRDCGLIQTIPRMTQFSYNEFYNHEYRKLYTGKETATDDFFKAQQAKGRRIFEYLHANKVLPNKIRGIQVLEVGCGAGGILSYFQDRGAVITGIDLGEEYINFGKSNYGLNLRTGTIASLSSYPTYDVIIYSHVLEHILDPNSELRMIKQRLAENGIVFVELPGVKYLYKSYNRDFLRMLQNAHVYYFTLTTLRNLFIKYNFQFVSGNEVIRSIFKKLRSEENQVITNDYEGVLEYLRRIEKHRKMIPQSAYNFAKRVRRILPF